MRLFFAIAALLLGIGNASADALNMHFFGSSVPRCSTQREPIVVVADLTTSGEIDDSITIRQIAQIAQGRCVDVRTVVSIFGNGESSTAEVHDNLMQRLPELGLADWRDMLLRGPDFSVTSQRTSDADHDRYRAIAHVIRSARRPVTIVELGPMTISAALLKFGYVEAHHIGRVLGVGGRTLGESFGTGRGLGAFGSFSDFNVRKDSLAVDYLVRYHGAKVSMVTYRTGIGARMVTAHDVATTIPSIVEHAAQRAHALRRIGYRAGFIPSWDTWLTSFFIKGGPERLGCKPTRARILAEEGAHNLRLILDRPIGKGHTIVACHHILQWPGTE